MAVCCCLWRYPAKGLAGKSWGGWGRDWCTGAARVAGVGSRALYLGRDLRKHDLTNMGGSSAPGMPASIKHP